LICGVLVYCEDQTGLPMTQSGLLEDRSLSGVGISVAYPVGIGTKIRIRGRQRELVGIVRHCRAKGTSYFVGIRLDEQDAGWASFGVGL
jgi:hypothetical protein